MAHIAFKLGQIGGQKGPKKGGFLAKKVGFSTLFRYVLAYMGFGGSRTSRLIKDVYLAKATVLRENTYIHYLVYIRP